LKKSWRAQGMILPRYISSCTGLVAFIRLTVRKNRTGHHDHVNSQEVTELIRELALVCDDSAIVSILNRLGYRTGIGNTWTEKRVQHVRHTNGFPACPPPEQRRWITMQQAASALQVSYAVVRRLVVGETGIEPVTPGLEGPSGRFPPVTRFWKSLLYSMSFGIFCFEHFTLV